jgi:hypothetical protein
VFLLTPEQVPLHFTSVLPSSVGFESGSGVFEGIGVKVAVGGMGVGVFFSSPGQGMGFPARSRHPPWAETEALVHARARPVITRARRINWGRKRFFMD